jgi:hypothetical protein
MTGVAAMLGLCAVTIGLLVKLNADGQARRSASAALDRLAAQFRTDVHACAGARLGQNDAQARGTPSAHLHLALGQDRSVSYEARNGDVVRLQIDSGKPAHHESYRLGPWSTVAFADHVEGPRRFVALRVSSRRGRHSIDPALDLEVLALPGKHRTATAQEKGTQEKGTDPILQRGDPPR